MGGRRAIRDVGGRWEMSQQGSGRWMAGELAAVVGGGWEASHHWEWEVGGRQASRVAGGR